MGTLRGHDDLSRAWLEVGALHRLGDSVEAVGDDPAAAGVADPDVVLTRRTERYPWCDCDPTGFEQVVGQRRPTEHKGGLGEDIEGPCGGLAAETLDAFEAADEQVAALL